MKNRDGHVVCDSGLCPVCHKNNNCALHSKTSKPCWCTEMPSVLDLPSDGKARACLCQNCFLKQAFPKLSNRNLPQAMEALVQLDPRFASWMPRLAPSVKLHKLSSAFHTLAHSILAQQLAWKAARTITARVAKLCERTQAWQPSEILRLCQQDEGLALRGCGCSFQKITYLHALAEAFLSGPLRGGRFAHLSNEELIERLTTVKGIGRWTAEMFLIFGLRRPDVFAPGDLALRRGAALVVGTKELSEAASEDLAQKWAPLRSVASLVLWEMAHLD
jgi:DNA-3-methyladenine glycosylase II